MYTSIWQQVLPRLSQIFDHNRFETWIRPLVPQSSHDEATLVLAAPNAFYCQFLTDHYKTTLLQQIQSVSPSITDLTFVAQETPPQNDPAPTTTPSATPVKPIPRKQITSSNLNRQYTFDSFVVGSSNEFAKSVSLAVAEAPGGTKFNPLLIYGGVGLGKTHLMHAIGNLIEETRENPNVTYITSEEFYFDFIDAIKNNQSKLFSDKFRNSDVLLVDDVQFMSGKDRTQEEFFYIFNTLYQSGKQIVLTSDLPPSAVKGIQDRLVSRFQWGLAVDIQPPDLETRVAILKKKAEKDRLTIPDDVIYFIAEHVSSNIREIEGVVIKLLAFSSIARTDITLDVVRGILKDSLKQTKSRVSIDQIIECVADYYKVPVNNIREKNRRKEVAHCRQVAMYVAKTLTNHSLKTIGLHFGGRDHSTVIHAVSQVERLKENDESLLNDINYILTNIDTNISDT